MNLSRSNSVNLEWPYRMQDHPTDPDQLGTQQMLERLLAPTAKKTMIGFGGPKGGGKSYAARGLALTLAYNYPIVIVLIRSRLKTLVRNHILPAKNELREWLEEGILRYNDKDKIFYMPGGGMVQFAHCTNESDIDQFDGVAADLYIFEEAGHFNKTMIDGIIKNNRASDIAINRGALYLPKSLFTFNWGGPGHSTLRRWFWDKIYDENEDPDEFFFIFASLDQNQALLSVNPQYKKRLMALPKNLREAYLTGDPDAMVGTVFMIVPKYHNVKSYEIFEKDESDNRYYAPEEWRIVASLDAGRGAPCSFGLYAITPDKDLYKLFTYYYDPRANSGVKRTPQEHIKAIMERIDNFEYTRGMRPEFIVADSYAFQVHNQMEIQAGDVTWEDLFAKHDIPLYEVKYRRLTALMGLHVALHFELDDQNEELFIKPKLQFLDGYNDATIDELNAVQASRDNPEDIDPNSVDHAIDETKNMVLCAESPPVYVPVKRVKAVDYKVDYGSNRDRLAELKSAVANLEDSYRNAL